MFLIHGIRRKELSGHLLPGACPICNAEGSVQLYILQPYAHFFWLPLFPLPRRGLTKCMLCGHEVSHRKLPLPTRELFKVLKGQGRTLLWMFSGVAILAVVLPLFVQAMMRHGEREADLLKAPQVGDVWTIELGHKHYTLYRVEEVRPDSVYVLADAYEVEDAGVVALSKFELDTIHDFTGEPIGFARTDLLELKAHGPIHSVDRKLAADSLR